MNLFKWFKKEKSATDKMRERETQEFLEAIRKPAITVEDGCMRNHGLSEYGARCLIKEGRKPGPLEHRVLLNNGEFISFEEYKRTYE